MTALDRKLANLADPRDAVRDRWRDLSCQDRPVDPYNVPFDPKANPIPMIGWVVTFIVLASLWWVL